MHPTRILRTTGFRLTVLYAGLFGISVMVLFGMIYWITGHALRQQLTANVESEINTLVEDYNGGGISQTADIIRHRLAAKTVPTAYYLLLDSVGQKVAGNLPDMLPRNEWQTLPMPRRPGTTSDKDYDYTEHHLLAFGVTFPDGGFLLVGEDTHHVVEVKEAIVRAFGWAFGITVVLGALGGAALSFGFLRRVDSINRTSRAIIDGRLADRIPTRGTGDELDRLALNLNEMLDRVQALMESLRQVSSDIAHDLRTPLSRLRQKLEGTRLSARSVDDYKAAVDQAIDDTDTILGTFTALLRIAQIEAGTRKAAFSDIDLSGVFRSIEEAYAPVAEDRRQVLAADVTANIRVRGDRELLTQMMANLVENAMRHTPQGTRIQLLLKDGLNGPVGIVADTGPGIPPGSHDKVLQRFVRLEQSRSTPGSGLGLSLVAAIAKIHDIHIAFADNKPGLKVVLEFASRAGF